MVSYIVFNVDDDESFVMSQEETFEYLYQERPDLFMSFNVETDGEEVVIVEPSHVPNGNLGRQTVEEFFRDYEEEGIIIRPVKEFRGVK